jgi:hypothetical protein
VPKQGAKARAGRSPSSGGEVASARDTEGDVSKNRTVSARIVEAEAAMQIMRGRIERVAKGPARSS